MARRCACRSSIADVFPAPADTLLGCCELHRYWLPGRYTGAGGGGGGGLGGVGGPQQYRRHTQKRTRNVMKSAANAATQSQIWLWSACVFAHKVSVSG